MKMTRTGLLKVLWCMVLLFMMTGCVSEKSRFAVLRHDDQVKQAFEQFRLPEGYKFYCFGSVSHPEAVIGISKEFVLESSLWQPVELTGPMLHEWIWIYANRIDGDMRQFGSNIVGPNKEHIGIWYSLKDWKQWARIELTDGNTVKIGSPINEKDGVTDHFWNRSP